MKCPVCSTEFGRNVRKPSYWTARLCPGCNEFIIGKFEWFKLPLMLLAYLSGAFLVVYLGEFMSESWEYLLFYILMFSFISLLFTPCFSKYRVYKKNSFSKGWRNFYLVSMLVLMICTLPFIEFVGFGLYHQYIARDVVKVVKELYSPRPIDENRVSFWTSGTGHRLKEVIYNYQTKNFTDGKIGPDDTTEPDWQKIPWRKNLALSPSDQYSFKWDKLDGKLAVIDNTTGKVIDRILGGNVKSAWWSVGEDRLNFLVEDYFSWRTFFCYREYGKMRGVKHEMP